MSKLNDTGAFWDFLWISRIASRDAFILFDRKVSFAACLNKKMFKSRTRQLLERARGASEAFEMQLRCQHCSLTCVILGSTLGKQQSPQTPSASLDCLIAELIQPVHLHRDHLNRLFIKASSPVLPASEYTTKPNQAAQLCIITLGMLLLFFFSLSMDKMVERLLMGGPSRAQTEA